jgi:hypothetical protein
MLLTRLIVLAGLLMVVSGPVSGQDYDTYRLSELPKLTLPARLKSSGLPYKVDHSRTKHFPPIFIQYGYSCNQSASIAVDFTYEMNAMRDADAFYAENQLPAFFAWNMMNSGDPDTGVSYFESWDLISAIGCPNWMDYGYDNINATKWMSGYYRYYRGMKNRIDSVWSIDVGNEEGLLTLKHWLYDHLGAYRPGGAANFQIATLDLQFWPLPEGTEDAGKLMIPHFSFAVGHAMTFVGYNDSVRYDFNHDGRYTNDLDINGDGEVTMADWEIGALICVNTYGTEWGDEGRAYVPYRILPLTPEQGGIWMKSAVVALPHPSYQPRLTLKARLRYPQRNKLWITAGVSQNPDATEPDHILDQPVFHYQGGALPMQGNGPVDPGEIEIGIDATPLLGYLEKDLPATFFLVVCEKDPGSTSEGTVENFSFYQYNGSETEYPGAAGIPIDTTCRVSRLVMSPSVDIPVIPSGQLAEVQAGPDFSASLDASGGTPPYRWELRDNYYEETRFNAQLPTSYETKILPDWVGSDRKTVALPFGFPYRGQVYHEMTLMQQGGILLKENNLYIPYGIGQEELLGLHSAIFPFYSTEFKYPDYLDGVYYVSYPNEVTVYWNASLDSGGEVTDVNFSVRLYPDGTIEFYYGDFPDRTTQPWLIGLTGGSRKESWFPSVNATGVRPGLNIRFRQPELPGGLKISPEGLITCHPDEPGRTWKIPVRVKDANGLEVNGFVNLKTNSGTSTGPVTADSPDIRVYPNPVGKRLFIDIGSPADGPLDVEIYSLAGVKVMGRRFWVRAGSGRLEMELDPELAEGVYIIRTKGVADFRGKIYRIIPAG